MACQSKPRCRQTFRCCTPLMMTIAASLWLSPGWSPLSPATSWGAGGELEIVVTDEDGGPPVPVRMHLKDQRGRQPKVPGVPTWKDHFVFPGKLTLKLPPGTYNFEMERGPEYRTMAGYFSLAANGKDTKTIAMHRFVDMAKEGWYSGDLHVHRELEDIELLMLAEDLHVAPVITWWRDKNLWAEATPAEPLVKFDGNRYYHKMAGEDERGPGALLFFNLDKPLPIAGSAREYPSPVEFLKLARRSPSAHVDVEKPFWWDMPVWIASGMVDSIGLANNHQHRAGMLDGEAWGKARDKTLFPSPLGNGRWSQEIYYRLLNCGVRIPPSAGSASGVLPNPVGYNRVYVHCGDDFSYENWFAGLKAGRVVVTNGPLLRPLCEQKLPGHVFHADAGETLELQITLNLSTRDPIEYLEVIQNGQMVHEVRLDKWAEAGGRLPPVKFDKSGWLLVRAVTKNNQTYRFASSGPWYVEVGYEQRISRRDAQFFLDWVYERARALEIPNPQEKATVLQYHQAARDFWKKRVEQATTD